MSEFSPETAGVIFTMEMIADTVYAYYIARVTEKKALQATLASLFFYGVSIYSFYNVIENPLYFIPAALGGATGTYISIKMDGWRREEMQEAEDLSDEEIIYQRFE